MEAVVNLNNRLGECVPWCARTGRMPWTGILGGALYAHQLDSGRTAGWPPPERLAWFTFPTGALAPIAVVEPGLAARLNDSRCERAVYMDVLLCTSATAGLKDVGPLQ